MHHRQRCRFRGQRQVGFMGGPRADVQKWRAKIAVGKYRAARRRIGMGIGAAQHWHAIACVTFGLHCRPAAHDKRARAEHQEQREPAKQRDDAAARQREHNPGSDPQWGFSGGNDGGNAAAQNHPGKHVTGHQRKTGSRHQPKRRTTQQGDGQDQALTMGFCDHDDSLSADSISFW